jgi:RNA polymerase sigma-70 factor (ECF subfamily)
MGYLFSMNEALEKEIRDLFDKGDLSGAAAATVRGYGAEIFGFLVATHRSEQDASDVFSDFTEALLKGLPTFAWVCSMRTWAYTIARNASHRFRRDTRRAGARRAGASALDDVAQAVRTETLAYLKTQNRTRLEELRDSLDPEDRELLILRVDRNLSWNDLALALNEEPPTDLSKESARLRKRFQLLKETLRDMARREGLLP